jgi:hypothetical protein
LSEAVEADHTTSRDAELWNVEHLALRILAVVAVTTSADDLTV